MNRPIIVPLDSSVFAGSSISLARALARRSGAPVHLVRIDAAPDSGSDAARTRESLESYLDGMGQYFVSELGAHRVRTELVRGKKVLDALAAHARARDAAMVVLAGNGIESDGYSRGLETAVRLGRESGVPVLLVHPRADTAGYASSLDRVVVALSDSGLDDELLEAAGRLGGDEITMVAADHTGAAFVEAVRDSAAGLLVASGDRPDLIALYRALRLPTMLVTRAEARMLAG